MKKLSFFVVLSLLCSYFLQAEQNHKICLNMIVKNESAVIKRCLESVRPIIDYWVIVDTGSSDGTQTIIKNYLNDIPGELHERPWVNFSHNRNEALELAKSKADYVLIIDADEILEFNPDFKLPQLDKDFYYIETKFAGTIYSRIQLIKNNLNWKWIGVLHEALDCQEIKTAELLPGVYNVVRTDGFRSQDPRKFHKDAELLEKALIEEPNNSRYQFYLAQSYKDAQVYDLAIKNYQKRILMGGWDQEVFWCWLQIAILQELLETSPELITTSYMAAYTYRPSRIEPLYYLANFYRRSNNFLAGYETAAKGISNLKTGDILFVEKWIYDYGLLLEFSVCAYWIEKYTEALLASQLILSIPDLPQHVKECVETNLVWIRSKLSESKGEFENQKAA